MCKLKSLSWYKLAALFLVLALVMPLLFACGDEKEETLVPTMTPRVTYTATSAQTSTPTATPSPIPSGPVKIGAVKSWSGPMAVSGTYYADKIIPLVEKQVKDMGGILGGRDVDIIKYDDGSSTIGAVTAAKKAVLEDNVSVLIWGGTTQASGEAVAGIAEENQILFVDIMPSPRDLTQYKYTMRAGYRPYLEKLPGEFTAKVLKPKKVAILGRDLEESRKIVDGWEEMIQSIGAEVVYKQFAAADVVDFSPYLTKIKYAAPEVLLTDLVMDNYLAIMKQMTELGGWGNILHVCNGAAIYNATKPGAEGWYIPVQWLPDMNYPGSEKFKQDFQAMFGNMPDANFALQYEAPWAAIKAIELAGTDSDRIAIAQAARSGNLTWDSPMGFMRYGTDGEAERTDCYMGHVEAGKIVLVEVPN